MMMKDYMITRMLEKAGIERSPVFYTQNTPKSPKTWSRKNAGKKTCLEVYPCQFVCSKKDLHQMQNGARHFGYVEVRTLK